MLIQSNDNDDDTSTVVEDDDEINLVLVNDMIQSGWNEVEYDPTIFRNTPTNTVAYSNNTQSSGILIVPGAPDMVSFDADADVLVSPDQSMSAPEGAGNLSIPSTIPTILPDFSREDFTKVSSNLTTIDCDDSPSDSGFSSGGIFGGSDCSLKDAIDTGINIFYRQHNRIFFLSFLLTSAITMGTVTYLVHERSVWRSTTLRLEETMLELKRDSEVRLQLEQEKRLAREKLAFEEQSVLTSKFHELMARLKVEDDARVLEKQKADILEREVRRLQDEVSLLDKESKRAKELEEMVSQLRVQAEDREFQRIRASKLEKEMRMLEEELNKNSHTSQDFANTNDNYSKKYTFYDNCWLQGDIFKVGLGECALKAGDTASQKIRKWTDTISKAHEHVIDRMAQDYYEIKEMFQTKDSPSSDSESKTEMNDETDSNENYFLKADTITKLWADVGGTLSKAHGLVMDQMAKDYSDIKKWHNDILSGNTFESSEPKQDEDVTTDVPKSAMPQETPYSYLSPSKSEETIEESDFVEKSKESVFFSQGVKKVIYGAASAALATVAVEVVGSWLGSAKNTEETKN